MEKIYVYNLFNFDTILNGTSKYMADISVLSYTLYLAPHSPMVSVRAKDCGAALASSPGSLGGGGKRAW